MTRKCPKPGPFPEGLQTLGDHLKAKRLAEGLLLKKAAQNLGVSPFTLSNWERGRTTPRIVTCGRVVAFLGFDPEAGGDELSQRMIAFRRHRGLTQRAAAKALGVDPTTWWGWESGRRRPEGSFARRLGQLLGSRTAATPR